MTTTLESQTVGLRANPLTEKPHWLKVGAKGAVGVDRVNKAVMGYVVAQEGSFREPDPRGEFDEKSLRQIVSVMKLNANGTKVRLGHGSASDDGASKFLGRAKNPRIDVVSVIRDGKQMQLMAVRADLYLAESAFETNPNGNIGEWLLTLGDEDPGAIGSSLVLQIEEEWRLDNHKQPRKDDEGNVFPPLWRVLKIHSSDIVADGAAVDELLSIEGLPDEELRKGVQLLDAQFAAATPDVIRARLSAFIDRYLSYRFGGDDDDTDTTTTPPVAVPEVTAVSAPVQNDEALLLDLWVQAEE